MAPISPISPISPTSLISPISPISPVRPIDIIHSKFSPKKPTARFKSLGITKHDDLRRHRGTNQAEIRRVRRDERISKRRNLSYMYVFDINPDAPGLSDQKAIDGIIKLLDCENPDGQIKGAKWIRNLIKTSHELSILSPALEQGGLPMLIELLTSYEEEVQYQALWTISNLAASSTSRSISIVNCGTIDTLVKLLDSLSSKVSQQASWALANLAQDADARNLILDAGGLDSTINLIKRNHQIGGSGLADATWALSSLCQGSNMHITEVNRKALPLLLNLTKMTNLDVVTEAICALSYIAAPVNRGIELIGDMRVAEKIMKIAPQDPMNQQNNKLISAFTNFIANVTDNEIKYINDQLVHLGVVSWLHRMLYSEDDTVRENVCFALSNITSGGEIQLRAFMDSDMDDMDGNMIGILIGFLTGSVFQVKKEACWVICNAITNDHATKIDLRRIVEKGCIKPLSHLLTSADNEMLLISLESIDKILALAKDSKGSNELGELRRLLEQSGAVGSINRCVKSSNRGIFTVAQQILDNYFNDEMNDMDLENWR